MRSLALIAVVLLVAPVRQENEAEKLFRAMEKKIRSSKSLYFVFEGQATDQLKKSKYRGTFYLEGTKFRMVHEISADDKTEKDQAMSDGKSTYSKFGDKETTAAKPPQERFFEDALPLLTRAGAPSFFGFVQFGLQEAKNFDHDKFVVVKDFKLGAKEKIGKQDTQIVEYRLFIGKDPPINASVWIDTKRLLPVKQVNVGEKEGKEEFRDAINFSAFIVNGKIDPKVFELPK